MLQTLDIQETSPDDANIKKTSTPNDANKIPDIRQPKVEMWTPMEESTT
jgi:hypothetical protein